MTSFTEAYRRAWRGVRALPLVLLTAIAGGAVMTCLGLVCGVVYSVGGFFVDLFTVGLNFGTLLAFGALVGMPLLFGVVGVVAGALLGFVLAGARAALTPRRTPPA